ncbi:hypothetical protein NFI96_013468 [Prochilodus magdalenae]|nr:hypothetical protein NFI96_013468 [Prochilodus magdalenae]
MEAGTMTPLWRHFKEYADFFLLLADLRKQSEDLEHFLQSPWVVSNFGYGTGEHAPSIKEPLGGFLIRYVYRLFFLKLKAVARPWHVYKDKYRVQQGGKVGIALNCRLGSTPEP